MYIDITGIEVNFVYDGNVWQITASIGVQGPTGPSGPSGPSQIPNTLTVTTDYLMIANDYYVGVNCTTSSNVTLPTANVYNGRIVIVKDESGNCSNNPITVIPPSGIYIDNDGSAILQIDRMSLTLIYNNGWRII